MEGTLGNLSEVDPDIQGATFTAVSYTHLDVYKRQTKAIAGRYGGLENLGEKLMKSENFEMALDEIVWLLTLLANQSVLIHNLKNKDAPQELLTEEEVELLTSPLDLAAYKNAITEAMFKGCLLYTSGLLWRT